MTEKIYYNVELRSNNYITTGTQYYEYKHAKFRELRSSPIIKNLQNYEMGVVRASFPLNGIPLHIFQIVEGDTQTNENLGVWRITFKNNLTNVIYQQNVIFIPQNINIPLNPNTGTYVDPPSQNNGQQVENRYYFIYSYKWLVYLINNALITLHLAAGGVLGQQPYFIYQNSKFNFILPSFYTPWNVSYNNIDIYFNDVMKTDLLGPLPLRQESLTNPNDISVGVGMDWKLLLGDETNTTGEPYFKQFINVAPPATADYYIFEQEFLYSPQYLNPINKIYIISNTINARKELISGDSFNNFTESNNNSLKAIFSFIPDIQTGAEGSGIQNFYSSDWVNSNIIDLLSTGELYSMDIEVYIKTKKFESLLPLYLCQNQSLLLKFIFNKIK